MLSVHRALSRCFPASSMLYFVVITSTKKKVMLYRLKEAEQNRQNSAHFKCWFVTLEQAYSDDSALV